MVLGSRVGVILAALFVISSAACMHAAPTARLVSPTPISIAIVHDKGDSLAAVPSRLREQVQSALADRNLVGTAIGDAALFAELQRKRASKDRLELVASHRGEAELVLLVETRAEYFSQLNGRYRWTVYVKLSMARADTLGEARVSQFDVPVMLSFDHQREADALAYAAGPIARKLGQELDTFLAGLNLETHPLQAKKGQAQEAPLGPIYFVMVDRFANGDSSNDGAVDVADPQAFHGGDLKGLIGKLDYIADLGFKTLWLAPVFAMRTEKVAEHGAFHGYWTEDLRRVEPRFGSDADMRALKEALDARGMRLVLDMVLNHVGYETALVREQPTWFHGLGDVQDWNDPVQLTTHDVHGLPDLNQNNPDVFRYLRDASERWINTLKPAGFRLDAVKHVDNDFWRRYTTAMVKRAGPGFATIGEIFDGNPAVIAKGFVEGGFSHLFDFPLYYAMTEVFCNGGDVRKLAATLSLDRLYPDPQRLVTFADNHDLPRVASACNKSEPRVVALLSFMLTARGVPAINYGTEAGLEGMGEPQNRGDMLFAEQPTFAGLVRRLLQARREHAVLTRGRDSILFADAQHLVYERRLGRETALIAINLSDSDWHYQSELSLVGAMELLAETRGSEDGVVVPPLTVHTYLIPAASAPVAQAGKRMLIVVASAPKASELMLVGDGPELGSWQVAKAPRGQQQADGDFRFEIELPTHSVAAFKLVRKTGTELAWEPGDNRYLVTSQHPRPLALQFGEVL